MSISEPGVRRVGREPCEPVAAEPALGREHALVIAARLKAVSSPVRLQVLDLVVAAGAEGARVPEIEAQVGVRGPTVSHHLRLLREAGLVARRREGQLGFYAATPAAGELLALIRRLAGTPVR